MNELLKLLKIEVNENQEQTIKGRNLYEFLQIKTPYTIWINRAIKKYKFIENIDYTTDYKNVSRADGSIMPQKEINHTLTMDMAKELSMLADNERGKEARKYFIKCQKAWNSPEMVMARAMKIMETTLNNTSKELEEAKNFIEDAKPKLSYYDKILASYGTMTTTQIAKDYGMSAQRLHKILNEAGLIWKVRKQWVLFHKWDNKGLVDSETIRYANSSTVQTAWTQRGRLLIHDILKQRGIFPNCDKNKKYAAND